MSFISSLWKIKNLINAYSFHLQLLLVLNRLFTMSVTSNFKKWKVLKRKIPNPFEPKGWKRQDWWKAQNIFPSKLKTMNSSDFFFGSLCKTIKPCKTSSEVPKSLKWSELRVRARRRVLTLTSIVSYRNLWSSDQSFMSPSLVCGGISNFNRTSSSMRKVFDVKIICVRNYFLLNTFFKILKTFQLQTSLSIMKLPTYPFLNSFSTKELNLWKN